MSATERPWHLDGDRWVVNDADRIVTIMPQNARGQADGELIVRAVNVVDDLAAALRDVLAADPPHDPDCASERDNLVVAHEQGRELAACTCYLREAHAALARAEGKLPW